jgi:plastocyanin
MTQEKRMTGLAVLLSLLVVMVVTGFGIREVFAEPAAVTHPLETEKAIEVMLNDDYFNPKTITIPNGKTTTFLLKNAGKKEHTFTVQKLGIDAEVQPGKAKTITVTPKQPGTYELICRYHFQEGMAGQIIVK